MACICTLFNGIQVIRRSQWSSGLRRGFAAVRLLGLRVRIPPVAWISVSRECCVWSGTSLCEEPITRLEESYRLWCVTVCDTETSKMKRPWPASGCCAKGEELRLHSVELNVTSKNRNDYGMKPPSPKLAHYPYTCLEWLRTGTTGHQTSQYLNQDSKLPDTTEKSDIARTSVLCGG